MFQGEAREGHAGFMTRKDASSSNLITTSWSQKSYQTTF